MKYPEEYVVPGKENHVCKLKWGIYGMKQVAKVWNERSIMWVDDLLKKDGFRQSQTDSCLYIKDDKWRTSLFHHIRRWILIASKNTSKIDKAAGFFKKHFKREALGPFKHYFGIEIRKNENGFYCIKQIKYIQEFYSDSAYNMQRCLAFHKPKLRKI